MRSLIKIVFYLLLLAVVVAGGGVAAFLYWPSDSLAKMIAAEVKENTGRTLTIEGEIERSVFPVLGVKLGKVTFSNADWAESGPLLTAESAEFGVRAVPLLGGAVEITKIVVAKPDIRLEIAENGSRSWEIDAPRADAKASGGSGGSARGPSVVGPRGGSDADAPPPILAERIEISDGRLQVIDHGAGGAPIEVSDINLNGGFASLEDDFVVKGSAVAQGRPARLDVKLASPAALARGDKATLAALLEADGVAARINGDVRAPAAPTAPEAKGTLTVSLDGDKKRTAWVRALLPAELAPLEALTLDGAFVAQENGLDVTMNGRFGFRGEPTTLRGSAKAGAGWASGATPVAVDAALANRLIDAGFDGSVVQNPSGPPRVNGEYRLKSPDAQALMLWSGAPRPAPGSPNALLESFDLKGGVDMAPEQLAAALNGAVGFNARSVRVEAGARGAQGWDAGGPIETNLTASAPALFTAVWKGSVDQARQGVKGDIRFSSSALRAFFSWLGLGAIDAPKGAFETLEFKSDLDVDPEKGAVENIELTLDKSAVTGQLTYDVRGERPSIKAALKSDAIDIRPFTAAARSGGGASPATAGGRGSSSPGSRRSGAATGWSKEPIDLGALTLVDAELDVVSAGLATDVAIIGPSRVIASIQAGKLVATVKEMALYGGSAVGSFTLDGSRATPALDLALDVMSVQLRPFLNNAAKMDWLEGTGALKVDIAGAGVSQDAMMRSLSGSASFDFRDGAILGYNIAAMVRNVTSLGQSGGVQKTDFAEMRASAQIQNGVANNNDLFMAGPLVRLTGSGVIDIGNQTINYLLKPTAVASLKGQGDRQNLSGVVVPVRVKGSWANPSVSPEIGAEDLIKNVDVLLADPEGAGAFLQDLEKDLLGGDGDVGDAVKGVLEGLTGGKDGDGDGGAGDLLKGIFGR